MEPFDRWNAALSARATVVEPGIALHFVDDLFAGLLYAALCNVEWRRRDSNESWHRSWRMAGELVAGLRGEGDYLSWYCWGHEGTIDELVLAELAALGWTPVSLEASP